MVYAHISEGEQIPCVLHGTNSLSKKTSLLHRTGPFTTSPIWLSPVHNRFLSYILCDVHCTFRQVLSLPSAVQGKAMSAPLYALINIQHTSIVVFNPLQVKYNPKLNFNDDSSGSAGLGNDSCYCCCTVLRCSDYCFGSTFGIIRNS